MALTALRGLMKALGATAFGKERGEYVAAYAVAYVIADAETVWP